MAYRVPGSGCQVPGSGFLNPNRQKRRPAMLIPLPGPWHPTPVT